MRLALVPGWQSFSLARCILHGVDANRDLRKFFSLGWPCQNHVSGRRVDWFGQVCLARTADAKLGILYEHGTDPTYVKFPQVPINLRNLVRFDSRIGRRANRKYLAVTPSEL